MSWREQLSDLADDQHVEQHVRAELGILASVRRGFIGVSVDDGVVELTGFTDSYAQKWEVERAASRVIGIRGVRDYLQVCPPAHAHRPDVHIAAAARCALEWDVRVPAGVRADVTDGALRLYGSVQWFAQREAAEEAVRNLVGLRDLSNEIKVGCAAPVRVVAGDVQSAMRRRFGAACRQVRVIEHDGVITVSGAVATLQLVGEIERTVSALPGVLAVDNRLLVAYDEGAISFLRCVHDDAASGA